MPDDATLPEGHFKKVGSNWVYYDNVMIGPGWRDRGVGWFDNFTEMASRPEITFFNVRTGSTTDYSYTNMESIDKIGRPFRFESLGIRFVYPDPHMSDQHQLNQAAAKFFQMTIPEHCVFKFFIRDDQWLTLRPVMAPPGWGYKGSSFTTSVNPSMSNVISSGEPNGIDRWRWLGNGIKIPESSQIKGTITFSEYGKELLKKLDAVWPLDGTGEDPFPNVAQIELSIRGLRYVQMRGEYYK